MNDYNNEHLSSFDLLTAAIEAAKEHSKIYGLTLTEAFNQKLHSSYNYSKGWHEDHYEGKFYAIEQYKAFFYNFIIGNSPELPEPVLYWATSYFRGYNYKEPDTTALTIIKEYTEALLISEQEEQQEIEQLEQETKEIRRILRHQDFLIAFEFVSPFIKLEEAGKLGSHEVRGKTALLTEMFNYGFILGKQAERARKHNT